MIEKVACKGHGRYVRLQLTEPDASGHYALSEMQVMGKGGLRAETANTLASKNGKQMLNQWQLREKEVMPGFRLRCLVLYSPAI